MASATRQWTREEVLALPDDGNRYELLDGELLVTPSPAPLHQWTVAALFTLVNRYVSTHRLGYTGFAPADLDLESGQLSQPDLYVVRPVRGRRPLTWPEHGIPLLVAEVISPSTARYDRITKRRRYQRAGVSTYWAVDLDARVVEEWRPDQDRPFILDGTLVWQPESALPPLEIDFPAFFSDLCDDG